MPAPSFEWLLRFGDSALVLSQRLSEWCGKGPALEEDLALANTALDLLGQARLWLSYAGEIDGSGRDEDQLAFLRGDREFRNVLLVEQPNGTYADTMVRQFYFDVWHHLALTELLKSRDLKVAAIAEKAVKEANYHLRRSSVLVVRLGDGTERSRDLMQVAADALWTYTGELFVADEVDRAESENGVAFDPAKLRAPWLACIEQVFEAATLKVPSPSAYMQKGGKQGIHTEQLAYLLGDMQVLQRAYPGARW